MAIKRYGASLANKYREVSTETSPVLTKEIKGPDAPKIVVPADKEKPVVPPVKEKEKETKNNEKSR